MLGSQSHTAKPVCALLARQAFHQLSCSPSPGPHCCVLKLGLVRAPHTSRAKASTHPGRRLSSPCTPGVVFPFGTLATSLVLRWRLLPRASCMCDIYLLPSRGGAAALRPQVSFCLCAAATSRHCGAGWEKPTRHVSLQILDNKFLRFLNSSICVLPEREGPC